EGQREGDPVGDPRQVLVLGGAEPLDQGGDEERPRGDAAQEEVADHPPAPIVVCDVVVNAQPSVPGRGTAGQRSAGSGAFLPRSRKRNRTPSATSSPAKTPQKVERGTDRLGTFGSDGSP